METKCVLQYLDLRKQAGVFVYNTASFVIYANNDAV
jgi:hypothetical protein